MTIISLLELRENKKERSNTQKNPKGFINVNDSLATNESIVPIQTDNFSTISGPLTEYQQYRSKIMRHLKISLIFCFVLAGTSVVTCVIMVVKLRSKKTFADLEKTGHDDVDEGFTSAILLTILSINLIWSYFYLNYTLN